MKRIIHITTTLSILGFCSCASISSYNTGKVLPHNKGELLLAAGYVKADVVNDSTNTDTSISLPLLEGSYRYGIAPNVDVAAKVTLPGTLGFDGRYSLLDNGEFAVAIGGGLAYTSFSINDVDYSLYDISVPLYASFHASDSFAIYATPRYLHRFSSSGDAFGLVGSAVGLRIGDTSGVVLEGTYAAPVGADDLDATTQGGIAFFIQN